MMDVKFNLDLGIPTHTWLYHIYPLCIFLSISFALTLTFFIELFCGSPWGRPEKVCCIFFLEWLYFGKEPWEGASYFQTGWLSVRRQVNLIGKAYICFFNEIDLCPVLKRFFFLVCKVSITSEIGPYHTIIYVVKYDVGNIFHRMIIKFLVPDCLLLEVIHPGKALFCKKKEMLYVLWCSQKDICLIEETHSVDVKS